MSYGRFTRKIHGNASDRISSKNKKFLEEGESVVRRSLKIREEQWSRFENIYISGPSVL